jgi:cell division protein FtsW
MNSDGIENKGGGYDGWLMAIIAALLCLGALCVFSAGASLDQQLDWRYFWKSITMRRVAFVPIALAVMAVMGHCNYRKLLMNEKHFWLSPVIAFLIISVGLLVLVLIPNIGTQVHSSRRWLVLSGGLQFQPSELAKWVVIMFLAVYAVYKGDRIRSFFGGFVPGCVVLLVVVGLIGLEDFGTAALVGAMGVLVLLMGGVRWWHVLILIPVALIAFYVLVYQVDYRWDRVTAFLHDNGNEQSATSYQANQSMMALGAGGMFGCGLGLGTVKLGHLPEDTTDFVFAIIGEELGFIGCAIVAGLFIALMICGTLVMLKSTDRLGQLLAGAITATIGAQALMNMMVVTGMAPTKGIALPFVSAGGSGLVMTALAAGVLINIARQKGDTSNP